MNPTAKPSFRVRSNGYDRGEVDEFIRVAQQESVRLELRVAQLDSTLEAILEYLQSRRRPEGVGEGPAIARAASRPMIDWNALASAWADRGRLVPMTAAVVVLALVSGALFWTVWHSDVSPFERAAAATTTATGHIDHVRPISAALPQIPVTVAAAERHSDPLTITPARPPVHGEAANAGGITLELDALTACWVGATLDGDRRVERLLQPGEHLRLSASDAAVLRVGSAGAISLRVNGLPGKSLGPLGRPVTIRVTPATYQQFLEPPAGVIASN